MDVLEDMGWPKRFSFFLKNQSVRTVARLIVAVPLGYAATSLLVALLGAAGVLVGVPRVDAVVLSGMAAFLLYMVWILWSFSARSIALVYFIAFAVGLASAGLLWLLGMPGG
ncbi:hypothetical protein [Ottowia thiooxydans]|uniref:Iron uptake protein n=1 Tax=Ottowia thiooxydans TaxID=219182 RepID=A0ABV2Q8U3_9BURK